VKRVGRLALAAVCTLTSIGAAPARLDSQVVLQRYAAALGTVEVPKVAIYVFSVSQAGPPSIEQRHIVYRSGDDVRDETTALDESAPKRHSVRITKRPDPYAIARVAPRGSSYELLFVRAIRQGDRLDYVYDAIPFVKTGVGFVVTKVTIDGDHYLPRTIEFTTSNGAISGSGQLQYGPSGRYWVPVVASVTATINGKPARERIVWSGYRFPTSLPSSTFNAAQPPSETALPPA
jgi:hypothetical protein